MSGRIPSTETFGSPRVCGMPPFWYVDAFTNLEALRTLNPIIEGFYGGSLYKYN